MVWTREYVLKAEQIVTFLLKFFFKTASYKVFEDRDPNQVLTPANMTRHPMPTSADPVHALENSFSGLHIFSPEIVERYFDRFNGVKGFQSNDKAPIQAEFDRLSQRQGWKRKVAHRERLRCYAEEAQYFLHTTPPGLTVFQNLCLDLNVASRKQIDGLSNTKCKKLLNRVFVNIFDYINCNRAGKAVQPVFHNKQELREHIARHGNVFPKAAAKTDVVLKKLLENIFGA